MEKTSKILVAGYTGLVGSNILKALKAKGYTNVIGRDVKELDFTNQAATQAFFAEEKPEYIFLAAAKVGGILANNTYPADFIKINLEIQTNIIDSAYKNDANKLLFLGSSCIYPKLAPQPIKEDYLLTGPLEPTNEPYAIAKIAGIIMCQSYRRQYGFNAISLMPTNLYGPGDNFNLQTSHVMPALIRKFHDAKLAVAKDVTVWGTGTPKREFLHVEDLAAVALYLMENYDQPEIVNVGVGEDVSIAELAEMVKKAVDFEGEIVYDTSKPDGTPRKLLDVSRLFDLGWRPSIPLQEGINRTYQWYLENIA